MLFIRLARDEALTATAATTTTTTTTTAPQIKTAHETKAAQTNPGVRTSTAADFRETPVAPSNASTLLNPALTTSPLLPLNTPVSWPTTCPAIASTPGPTN